MLAAPSTDVPDPAGTPPPAAVDTPDAATFSDDTARATLALIAESVAQMVGFEVAVISAVRDDVIFSVAIEGSDEVRAALSDLQTPVATVLGDLAHAEDWGRFKFIDHRHAPVDDYFWVPDFTPDGSPDAWHPYDALLAPLHTVDGAFGGLLSIDLPLSGRRPDATQRDLLERYAAQAERALQNAVERDQLAGRLRLAEAARRVVRTAISQPDAETALEAGRATLLEGFRADDYTLRTYADEVLGAGGSAEKDISQKLRLQLRDASRQCWAERRTGVLRVDQDAPDPQDADLIDEETYEAARSALRMLGHASAMLVPIGAGPRSLGHLVLFRNCFELAWTPDERTNALEIAADIGQAVLASHTLAREQRLVEELRELDRYKTQLLSTVSHELKNPLSAIAGHLELASESADVAPDLRLSLDAIERATGRISRVVEDLLTLSKLEDPEHRASTECVDLRDVLTSAVDASRLAAERRDVALRLETPDGPLPAYGDEDGLERVLANLVGNAVKYTREARPVTVRVSYRPAGAEGAERQVEIAVHDEGIGISADDQAQLFSEFFRSTNPVALAEPGTGLGLAISARIVDGHGGRIMVCSELGVGSTFSVVLRAPAAAHD